LLPLTSLPAHVPLLNTPRQAHPAATQPTHGTASPARCTTVPTTPARPMKTPPLVNPNQPEAGPRPLISNPSAPGFYRVHPDGPLIRQSSPDSRRQSHYAWLACNAHHRAPEASSRFAFLPVGFVFFAFRHPQLTISFKYSASLNSLRTVCTTAVSCDLNLKVCFGYRPDFDRSIASRQTPLLRPPARNRRASATPTCLHPSSPSRLSLGLQLDTTPRIAGSYSTAGCRTGRA